MSNRFRKQFIFGPQSLMDGVFEQWPSLKINGFELRRHPALDQNVVHAEENRVIFLGTAVHCENPDWLEADIAHKLANCFSDSAFLDELDLLCGTFVVVKVSHESTCFYHDMSSSGKIFYLNTSQGSVLGSDPKIIGEVVSLKKTEDPEALKFYNSDFFRKPKYKKWLGDLTWYRDLYQVLPNHLFDLKTQKPKRYYPRTDRQEQPIDEIVAKSASILKNLSSAIFNRGEPFVSVTAGWDSRVIVASTREHAQEATYYTFEFPNNGVNKKDVDIARRICADLNLNHVLERPHTSIPEKYADDIIHSFELRNDARYLSFFKLFDDQLVDTAAVTGSISEIAKNYFERLSIDTGEDFARAAHFPQYPYVVAYFQRWIDESKEHIEKLGYTPQDFAHWEQDIANFAGQGILSTSFIANRFSPFNCRKLIDVILHAHINYRDGYNNDVYRGIIKDLWPELLKYPVNPTLKVRLIHLAKQTGIYPVYKRIRQRISGN